MIFTGVDLSFVNLNPFIAEVKAAVGSTTDIYKSIASATAIPKDVSHAYQTVTQPYTADYRDSVNQDGAEFSNTWNTATGSSSIKNFTQKNINATAQFKSGKWLDDNDTYESMAGTPTTEDLYVTVGGSQWIVDLQYRYVTTDYTRSYNFKSNYVNYRYYKLNKVSGKEKKLNSIVYVGQSQTKPGETPEFSGANGGTNPKDSTYFTLHDGESSAGTVGETKKWGNYGYVYYDKDTNSGVAGKNKASDYEAASIVNNYSGEDCSANTSREIHPDVATAYEYKKAVADAILSLQAAWDGQDDNYRADQGNWDTTYEVDNDASPDRAAWNYTYAYMARHYSYKASKSDKEKKRDERKYFTHPYFVTYFLDWHTYQDANNISDSTPSALIEPKTVGESDYTFEELLETAYAKNAWKGKSLSTENFLMPTSFKSVAPWNLAGSANYTNGVDGIAWNTGLLADSTGKGNDNLLCRNQPLVCDIVSKLGADVVAKNWSGNDVLAFGGPCNITPSAGVSSFGITSGMLSGGSTGITLTGDTGFELSYGDGNGYPDKANNFSEGVCAYYRAVYELALLLSPFLTEEDLTYSKDGGATLGEILGAVPGFNGANSHAGQNMKKIFDNSNFYEMINKDPYLNINAESTSVMIVNGAIPFASFPEGGDLDAAIEHDGESYDYINTDEGRGSRLRDSSVDKVNMYDLCSQSLSQSDYAYTLIYAVNMYLPSKYTYQYTDECKKYYHKGWKGHDQGDPKICETATDCGYEHIGNSEDIHCTATHAGVINGVYYTTLPVADDPKTPDVNEETTGVKCATCGGDDIMPCPLESEKCGHRHYHDMDDWDKEKLVKARWRGTDYAGKLKAVHEENQTGATYYGSIEKYSDYLVYTEYYIVEAYSCVYEHKGMWSDEKAGNWSMKLTQNFKNVRWLDITSYSIWAMDHSESKGLSQLLASPSSYVNSSSAKSNFTDTIVSSAVNQLGYAVYDVDDSKNGTLTKDSDLQTVYGRVANSLWPGSIGNLGQNLNGVTADTGNDDNYNIAIKHYDYITAMNVSDVPYIVGEGSFVNSDNAAFIYTGNTGDDLNFKYNTFQQGGRSNTCWQGFIAQALAHTLTYKVSTNDVYCSSNCPVCHGTQTSYARSYSNSLLIQGDYLSMDTQKTVGSNSTTASYETIVGQMFDTWADARMTGTEHYVSISGAPSSTADNGAQYTLLPDSILNSLSAYQNSCRWIPGHLSYMVNRAKISSILSTGYKEAMGKDCWTIHTYCKGINGNNHVCWDSVETDGSSLSSHCANNNKTTQGDVNYVTTEIANNPLAGMLVSTSNLSVHGLSGTTTPFTLDRTVSIATESKTIDDLIPTNSTSSTASNENRDKTLSYVGYAAVSDGNKEGTKDLVLNSNGSAELTTGYAAGTATAFQPHSTYVSEKTTNKSWTGNYNNKSFALFGFTLPAANSEPKYVTPVIKDVKATKTDGTTSPFSANYPWAQSLNVDRFISNGCYKTGTTSVLYKQIANVSNTGQNSTTNGSDKTLLVNAGYLNENNYNTTSNYVNRTNDVIIYNPVSTTSSYIKSLSEYTPDGTNTGSSATKAYLQSFLSFSKRDSRTIDRYLTQMLNATSGERYIHGSTIESGETTYTGKTYYTYRNPSAIETTGYTKSDYKAVTKAPNVITLTDESSGTQTLESGKYYFSLDTASYNRSGYFTASAGDKISYNGTYVTYTPVMSSILTYGKFEEAYKYYRALESLPSVSSNDLPSETNEAIAQRDKDLAEADVHLHMKKDSVFTISVGAEGENDSVYMKAGSVIKLTYFSTDSAGNGVADTKFNITCENTNITISEDYYDATDTRKHWVYIKADSNTYLSDITMTAINEAYIANGGASNMLEVVPIPLFGQSGGVVSGSPEVVEIDAMAYVTNNTVIEGKWFCNKDAVTLTGSSYNFVGNFTIQQGFMFQLSNFTYSLTLTDDAKNQPHKVENADWRFYVIDGDWHFEDGTIIQLSDISNGSGALYQDTTLIQAPNGIWTTVGVMNGLCNQNKLIAIYPGDGRIYLSILDNSVNTDNLFYTDKNFIEANRVKHADLGYAYNSITATSADSLGCTLTFNNVKITSKNIPTVSFGNTTSRRYGPMSSNEAYTDCCCDYSFYVKNDASGDSYAYDVKASTNGTHRYTVADFGVNGKITVNGGTVYDIIQEYDAKSTPELSFTRQDGVTPVDSNVLSLDDEFTIYWDNIANLSSVDCTTDRSTYSNYNLDATTATLGRGWDCNGDDTENVPNVSVKTKVTSNGTDYVYANPDTMSEIWMQNEPNEDTPISQLTDTTKWIYRKYLIFSVDMYAFTTSGSFTLSGIGTTNWDKQFNPTTPAYDNNGKANNLVFIPAGTEVPLGYFKTTAGATDNNGYFVDYGNSDSTGGTKDPNGELYTYHFWCPLSSGESKDEAMVQFVVEAINNVAANNATSSSGKNSNTSFDDYTYSDTFKGFYATTRTKVDGASLKTEWGELIKYIGSPTMTDNVKQMLNFQRSDFGDSLAEKDASDNVVNYSIISESFGDSYNRYGNSVTAKTFSIMGSIGGLTIVDSGDPRYQDSFKLPASDALFAISPIVKRVTTYDNELRSTFTYSNSSNSYDWVDEGTQNNMLSDVIDVRGRAVTKDYASFTDSSYNRYTTTGLLGKANTYGTQDFKNELETTQLEVRSGLSDVLDTNDVLSDEESHISTLPLSSSFNVHDALKTTPTKIGYELYCSLDTIGDYYGASAKRYNSVKASNNNDDYGQQKIQIRPIYYWVAGDGSSAVPVDVYMRKGNNYVLINAGSPYTDSGAIPEGETDSGPYTADALNSSEYTVKIGTNSKAYEYGTLDMTNLDDSLLRRMVTTSEAATTESVMNEAQSASAPLAVSSGITKTLLQPNNYGSNGAIGSDILSYDYSYGNAQYLFLREYNRTFVGGTTLALNFKDAGSDYSDNAMKYGQKWYFGLGLPVSSVFVPHGYSVSNTTIKTSGYIICTIDVYAIGEKWVLHYDTPLSDMDFTIADDTYSCDEWNPYRDVLPNVIPVTYYDLSTSSAATDADTTGSH